MEMSEENWAEAFIKEERDLEAREERGTMRDEWIGSNLPELRSQFCEERSDEFNEFCREQYRECGLGEDPHPARPL
jgi:hypothetical protein